MRARVLVLWSELAPLEARSPSWDDLARSLPASLRMGIENSLRESDRHLRLVARLLLARALERIGGDAPPALSFDANGRPHLAGALDPSISHTPGLACAAVGIGCRIGIDVERRQPIEPSLHDRILTPEERKRFAGSMDRDGDFLGFWTRKEAAAKADGRGLQLDPQQLICRPGKALRGETVQAGTVTYRIRTLPLPESWIGALAYDAPGSLDLMAEAYSFT